MRMNMIGTLVILLLLSLRSGNATEPEETVYQAETQVSKKVILKAIQNHLASDTYLAGKGILTEVTSKDPAVSIYELSEPEFTYHRIEIAPGHIMIFDGAPYPFDANHHHRFAKTIEKIVQSPVTIHQKSMAAPNLSTWLSEIQQQEETLATQKRAQEIVADLENHSSIASSFSRQLINIDSDTFVAMIATVPNYQNLAQQYDPKNPSQFITKLDEALKNKLRPKWPRGGRIRKIQWNSEGLIAVATGNGNIIIIDSKTHQLVNTFDTNARDICSLGWSPDGKMIAAGFQESPTTIWDAKTCEVMRRYRQRSTTTDGVAFDPSNQYFAIQDNNGTLIYQTKTGRFVKDIEAEYYGNILSWSKDGKYQITSEAYNLTLTRHGSWFPIRRLEGGSSRNVAAWSPNSDRVAFGGGGITVNKTATGKMLYTLPCSSIVYDLDWSSEGNYLAATSYESKEVGIYEADTGKAFKTLIPGDHVVTNLGWALDKPLLVTGGESEAEVGTIRLWKFPEAKELTKWHTHTNPIEDLTWSADGSELLARSPFGLDIWNPELGASVFTPKKDADKLSFAHKGDRYLKNVDGKTIEIISTDTLKKIGQLEKPSSSIRALKWSRDDSTIAGILESKWIEKFAIWDGTTGKLKKVVNTKSTFGKIKINNWVIHPSGDFVAANIESSIKVWDTNRGWLKKEIDSNFWPKFDWSLDGSRFIISEDLAILDGNTFSTIKSIDSERQDFGVCLSPDGKHFASASQGGRDATIWDREGNVLHSLNDHSDWVRSLAWHPTEPLLATGSSDGSVRIWNTDTGESLLTLLSFGEKGSIAFDSSNRFRRSEKFTGDFWFNVGAIPLRLDELSKLDLELTSDHFFSIAR